MQFLCINQLINLIFDVVNKVELVDKVKIVGQRLRGQRGGFSRTLLTTDELLGKRQTDIQKQNHANAVTLFYHLLLSLTLIINIIQFQFHRGTQLQDLVIGTVGCLLALLKIFGTLHGFPVYLSIYVPHPVPSRVLCMCRGGAAVYGVWLCPGIPRHNLSHLLYYYQYSSFNNYFIFGIYIYNSTHQHWILLMPCSTTPPVLHPLFFFNINY